MTTWKRPSGLNLTQGCPNTESLRSLLQSPSLPIYQFTNFYFYIVHCTFDSYFYISYRAPEGVNTGFPGMRAAPPVAAALAPLAAGAHRARRTPARARALLRCAHTHPQIANTARGINSKKVHMPNNNRQWYRWLQCGLALGRRCAAAGTAGTLYVYAHEEGRAAFTINSPEHLSRLEGLLSRVEFFCHRI